MTIRNNKIRGHNFMRLGLLFTVAAAAGMLWLAPVANAADKTLKMAFFTGNRHPIPARIMIPWGKALEAANVGLKVQEYAGGQIGGPPPGAFKRTVNGISDVEWHLPGYTSTVFPMTLVMEIPLQWGSPSESTRAMWRIYNKHLAEEYKRVKLLALWATDVPVVMTNKLVRHPDDLKGLKIRTPSANQAAIIVGLGAIPVAMPMPQTYGALEKGVVDGAIVGISVVRSFKLAEVVKYYIVDLPFGYSPQIITMNLKTYRGLNKAQRAAVDGDGPLAMSLKAVATYEAGRQNGINEVKKRSNTQITTLTAAEKAAWVERLEKVVDGWVGKFEKQGLPYRQLLKDYLNK